MNKDNIIKNISLYNENDMNIMQAAEDSYLPGKSRVEEIVCFAGNSGYKNIGIAYCQTFRREALSLKTFLEEKGFSVAISGCKTGNMSKSEILGRGSGTSCNPLLQAHELSEAGTELNIVMGLCMGHDILFSQHSTAPVTTLIVKDRKYGHKPLEFFKSPEKG